MSPLDDREEAFYHLSAGFDYHITETFTVNLGARYFYMGGDSDPINADGDVLAELGDIGLQLGFSLSF